MSRGLGAVTALQRNAAAAADSSPTARIPGPGLASASTPLAAPNSPVHPAFPDFALSDVKDSYYASQLFNELYFLVDGGTIWLDSSDGHVNGASRCEPRRSTLPFCQLLLLVLC